MSIIMRRFSRTLLERRTEIVLIQMWALHREIGFSWSEERGNHFSALVTSSRVICIPRFLESLPTKSCPRSPCSRCSETHTCCGKPLGGLVHPTKLVAGTRRDVPFLHLNLLTGSPCLYPSHSLTCTPH